jgi:hypothetical protein
MKVSKRKLQQSESEDSDASTSMTAKPKRSAKKTLTGDEPPYKKATRAPVFKLTIRQNNSAFEQVSDYKFKPKKICHICTDTPAFDSFYKLQQHYGKEHTAEYVYQCPFDFCNHELNTYEGMEMHIVYHKTSAKSELARCKRGNVPLFHTKQQFGSIFNIWKASRAWPVWI